jgi:hypothetical protein
MPFTAQQRQQFAAILQKKGWTLENDMLWSPSRGLYLINSHFEHWSPAEMCEVFNRRGDRIQKAALDGWERHVGEHRDVRLAAEEVTDA